ncbi:MAG TPA: hydroxymethylbilane synthase [Gelria sp.]|nr:hydroxymethylbilane synthase [Gelria sp.]
MKSIILGSRGSKLALWQANYVASQLTRVVPDLDVEVKVIKTKGDKILDVALSRIGDKGLFTKEIEKELLDGSIDMAIHSMKDLPSQMAPGLCIGAVLKRENPGDVLISRQGYKFSDLPEGAIIGTSSLRRISQIRALRPDIVLVDIRGNIETRIRKMHEQELDGIVLAYAGVKRLGLEEKISDILPHNIMLPAVGQGAIAIEVRQGDTSNLELARSINHEPTNWATRTERSFLKVLEGGCQVPIGCYAEVSGENITVEGLVASLDGRRVFRESIQGKCQEADLIGRQLARDLLQKGAASVLAEIRQAGE